MTLHEELGDLRRALAEVERALQPLRERPASRRIVQRLSEDLRRLQEDAADLGEDQHSGEARRPASGDLAPIPVPPADLGQAYDPTCEDEGLAGWRGPAAVVPPRDGRRR